MTTPTVEEIVKSWLRKEEDSYAYVNDEYLENVILDGGFNFDKLITTLTSYGTDRYKEGVKEERERCKNLVVAHLRTNTYDGNDALVFKTTIEEVVGLLSDKQPPTPCKECKQPIEPRKHPCGKVTKNDTYCSNECRLIARKRYSTWSWKRIVE